MRNPVCTYRLQLSPDFTFANLRKILDYLEELGISTIYSAPFFQARKGSSHGYDIIDPFKINEEIGSLEEFRKIGEQLQEKKMGWLQDIVPNHMAFDGKNVWLRDIFELGQDSEYFRFFDVNWDQTEQPQIMAAFLGDPLPQVLQKGEISVKLCGEGFTFNYFSHQYLTSTQTYAAVLSETEYLEWQKKFGGFNGSAEQWQLLKKAFLDQVEQNASLRSTIEERLESINSSEEKLKELLDLQYFIPVHWKTTEGKINYRRFFTINDLICLSMEDRKVFNQYHQFIFQLVNEGLITGLRIDHIDGLFDPKEYLVRLRKKVGEGYYVVIEKILEWDEKLPAHWPVQGTSGYGFLAAVNQVLTQEKSEAAFSDAYDKINPRHSEYAELVYEQKLFILKERMGGEYANLWELAYELDLMEPEYRTDGYKEALGAFLAGFPVYRIYPEEYPLRKRQRKIINSAYEIALENAPHLKKQLGYFRKLFLGEAEKDKTDMLFYLQRCQQFTGPLAAKGVEDTSFYIFNKLLSHNEVGDSPENFGLTIKGFHERMKKRREGFPLSINATATHDTKRGEDARMRINVLSEIPEEWFSKMTEWKNLFSSQRDQSNIPDDNEEYFIFQMLIGHWPFTNDPGEEFYERSKAYLQKVLREAKENSSWAEPDEAYENNVFEYLKNLLSHSKFKSSFVPFQQKVAAYGAIKSLSQCLLKMTAPGIPDIYQGTELWDLSYVDPDNRRPVDYELRKKYLAEIKSISKEELPDQLKSFKQNYPDARINMYCLYKALELRNKNRLIFEEGTYLPLDLEADFSEDIVAFARVWSNIYAIIFAPATVSKIFDEQLELKENVLNKKVLSLPDNFPKKWKNAFTKRKFEEQTEFTAAELFQEFPVAVLIQS
ncbi:malto-oligosyltrehalose synthase [Salinimicrobium soli]|uniref:malto-oligosyltrehalose synthase n=1 Tax=Salinimicrobium soli TaxID=1254399 RepID=UPI003AACD6DF